jgi:hypothetical protein
MKAARAFLARPARARISHDSLHRGTRIEIALRREAQDSGNAPSDALSDAANPRWTQSNAARTDGGRG